MKMEWIKGNPPEAMWCWATYLSNDDPPEPDVAFLWFNPSARGNWWQGEPGIVKNFDLRVTHWMKMPPSAAHKLVVTMDPEPNQIRIMKMGDGYMPYIKVGGSNWLKIEDMFSLFGDFDIRFEVKTHGPAND